MKKKPDAVAQTTLKGRREHGGDYTFLTIKQFSATHPEWPEHRIRSCLFAVKDAAQQQPGPKIMWISKHGRLYLHDKLFLKWLEQQSAPSTSDQVAGRAT